MLDLISRKLKLITILTTFAIGLSACASGPKIPTSEALVTSAARTLNILKNSNHKNSTVTKVIV